jgi:regulatory LuxR family protein
LLDAAVSQGRTGSIIEIQALRALAASATARARQARRSCSPTREATSASLPTRARLCASCSPPPGRTSRPRARGIHAGYLAALLRTSGEADAVPPQKRAAAAPPGLAEPLTGRELGVLRLLAAGKSNQRIAHDLVVALDTVKNARDASPAQARRRQPDRGRRAGPAAQPDP